MRLESREYRSPEPQSARIIGILFTLIITAACSILFYLRVTSVRSWKRLPWIRWLVILQYGCGFLYIIFSSVVQYGLNPNAEIEVCNASASTCLLLYGIIKMMLYMFLADRLHVVGSTATSRRNSPLFLVHTIGIGVGIGIVIVIYQLLRIFRIDDGVCIIGVQRIMMFVSFGIDVSLNLYLSAFFLFYLSRSFDLRPSRLGPRSVESLSSAIDVPRPLVGEINKLTRRSTIGLGITLSVTTANLITLTIMDGESLWLCFLTCKADLLVNVLVLHYMSSSGRPGPRNPHSATDRSFQSGGSGSRKDVSSTPRPRDVENGDGLGLADVSGFLGSVSSRQDLEKFDGAVEVATDETAPMPVLQTPPRAAQAGTAGEKRREILSMTVSDKE